MKEVEEKYTLPLNNYGNYDVIDSGMPKEWVLFSEWFNKFHNNPYPHYEFLTGFDKGYKSRYSPNISKGFHVDHIEGIAETSLKGAEDWRYASDTKARRNKFIFRINPKHYKRILKKTGKDECVSAVTTADIKCNYDRLSFMRWCYLLDDNEAIDNRMKSLFISYTQQERIDLLNMLYMLDNKACTAILTRYHSDLRINPEEWHKATFLQSIPLSKGNEILNPWVIETIFYLEDFINDLDVKKAPRIIINFIKYRLNHVEKTSIRKLVPLSRSSAYSVIGTRQDQNYAKRQILKTDPDNFPIEWNTWTGRQIANLFAKEVPEVLSRDTNLHHFIYEGYDLEMMLNCTGEKDVCRLLIDSAHMEERRLLLQHPKLFLQCISILHAAYTNSKGKVQRQQLLERIAWLNSKPGMVKIILSTLTGDQAMELIKWWSEEAFFKMITYANSQDTLRCTVRLLQDDHTRPLIEKRWQLLTETHDSISRVFADQWHDYVTGAAERHLDIAVKPNRMLPQSRLPAEMELPQTGLIIEIPHLEGELKTIGRNFRHCIGGQHYRNRAREGNYIFVLKPGDSKQGKGFTVFADHKFNYIQANGFANSTPTPKDREAISQALSFLYSITFNDESET